MSEQSATAECCEPCLERWQRRSPVFRVVEGTAMCANCFHGAGNGPNPNIRARKFWSDPANRERQRVRMRKIGLERDRVAAKKKREEGTMPDLPQRAQNESEPRATASGQEARAAYSVRGSETLRMTFVILFFSAVSAISAVNPAFAAETKDARLAAGKKVFVEPAEHAVDVAMGGELKKWGRWKIVAEAGEADILIRLRVSGNAAWGVGHVQAFVLDAKTRETLWVSKAQRGMRTVFHGYASPYSRAVSGIAGQMRKELGQ